MNAFTTNICDVFSVFGPVQVKAMFGGYGVYHANLMFGLVANDTLYLKADEVSFPLFNERGLPPFAYARRGKLVNMSYYAAPPEIFEDPEMAIQWADRAYQAALRSSASNKKPRRKKT